MTSSHSYSGRIQRGPMAIDVLGAHYTTIFNGAIRDQRLSRKARGLLVEILSHRDGYGISIASLVAGGPEGRDAIRTALAELETHGYLERHRPRNELGQWGDPVYKVTDMPDGLTIHADAPWPGAAAPVSAAPAEPVEQTPRSQPKSENPTLDSREQDRRSEPMSDYPTLDNPAPGNPTLGDPPHKKTTSSEDQSVEHHSLSPRASEPPERETAAPPKSQEPHRGGDVPRPRTAVDDARLRPVLDALAESQLRVTGRPPDQELLADVTADALDLLTCRTPPWPIEHVARLAGELAGKGWRSLARHAAHNPPAPSPATSRGTATPWCGQCNEGVEPAGAHQRFKERSDGVLVRCPACHPGVQPARATA